MSKRLLILIWLFSVTLLSQSSFGQARKPKPAVPPVDTVPLDKVIAQVVDALAEYQNNLGAGPNALPPLSSAEFDFKTTTSTTVGATVNLLIFKFGGSHENDVVHEVTYTYAVPTPPPHQFETEGVQPLPSLKDQLAQTIQSAAKAVKGSLSVAGIPFSKLTVNLQYGVKWDGNLAANVPIYFVTVGLSGDRNKNTVQSVKLVFGK